MRLITIPLLALAVAAVSCGSSTDTSAVGAPVTQPANPPEDESQPPDNPPLSPAEWTAGINRAGWEFHLTTSDNSVSSPLSIGSAFSLLRAGASNPTDSTLDSIFGFVPGEATHAAAESVLADLAASSTETTTLDVANALFLRFDALTPFTDTSERFYGAPPQPLSQDETEAANQINGWINDKTRGLIPKMVDPSDVAEPISTVIANTVYLHADWRTPFDPMATRPDEFITPSGDPVTADFMGIEGPLVTRYVEADGYVALELPYADGDLAMWIIVPTETQGLGAVEASLDAETIASLGDGASEGRVGLTMPKWEYTLPITDLLGGWLCPQGLCPGSPLLGIADDTELDFALHSAKIIVDEAGTEAAAATVIGARNASVPVFEYDLIVKADHPFAYVITHEPTGSLVFVGRVSDPTAP